MGIILAGCLKFLIELMTTPDHYVLFNVQIDNQEMKTTSYHQVYNYNTKYVNSGKIKQAIWKLICIPRADGKTVCFILGLFAKYCKYQLLNKNKNKTKKKNKKKQQQQKKKKQTKYPNPRPPVHFFVFQFMHLSKVY